MAGLIVAVSESDESESYAMYNMDLSSFRTIQKPSNDYDDYTRYISKHVQNLQLSSEVQRPEFLSRFPMPLRYLEASFPS